MLTLRLNSTTFHNIAFIPLLVCFFVCLSGTCFSIQLNQQLRDQMKMHCYAIFDWTLKCSNVYVSAQKSHRMHIYVECAPKFADLLHFQAGFNAHKMFQPIFNHFFSFVAANSRNNYTRRKVRFISTHLFIVRYFWLWTLFFHSVSITIFCLFSTYSSLSYDTFNGQRNREI